MVNKRLPLKSTLIITIINERNMPQQIIYKTNLKCPECGARKLTTAGKGVAEKYRVKTRYRCWGCGTYTVNPRKI